MWKLWFLVIFLRMVADLLCKNITHFSSKNKADFQGGEKINCFTLACTNKKKLKLYTIYVNPLSKNSRFVYEIIQILYWILIWQRSRGWHRFSIWPRIFHKKRGFFGVNPAQTPTPTPFLDPGAYGVTTPIFISNPDPGGVMTPKNIYDPDPGGVMTPENIFDPDPGGVLTPIIMINPDLGRVFSRDPGGVIAFWHNFFFK